MTSEELEQALIELNDQLKDLDLPEAKLTRKNWMLKNRLLKEKDYIEKIQQAKESRNTLREANLLADYNVFKEAYTRHPIINYIMQLKIRSRIWG